MMLKSIVYILFATTAVAELTKLEIAKEEGTLQTEREASEASRGLRRVEPTERKEGLLGRSLFFKDNVLYKECNNKVGTGFCRDQGNALFNECVYTFTTESECRARALDSFKAIGYEITSAHCTLIYDVIDAPNGISPGEVCPGGRLFFNFAFGGMGPIYRSDGTSSAQCFSCFTDEV